MKLAVDGQIKQSPISEASFVFQKEADGSNVFGLQRLFGTDHMTGILCPTIVVAGQ